VGGKGEKETEPGLIKTDRKPRTKGKGSKQATISRNEEKGPGGKQELEPASRQSLETLPK